MKKNLYYLSFALTIFAFSSCSKDPATNKTAASVTFTIDGTTFTQQESAYSPSTVVGNTTYASLTSGGITNGKKYGIQLIFKSGSKPTAGSYSIINSNGDLGANQLAMVVIDSISVAKEGLFTGQSGTANITVSNGKLTVAIPSCVLTGDNFNNTDPNNTAITEVEVNASGTVQE